MYICITLMCDIYICITLMCEGVFVYGCIRMYLNGGIYAHTFVYMYTHTHNRNEQSRIEIYRVII